MGSDGLLRGLLSETSSLSLFESIQGRTAGWNTSIDALRASTAADLARVFEAKSGRRPGKGVAPLPDAVTAHPLWAAYLRARAGELIANRDETRRRAEIGRKHFEGVARAARKAEKRAARSIGLRFGP